MFVWHTVHAMAALQQYNYSRYRFANIYIRLQVRITCHKHTPM